MLKSAEQKPGIMLPPAPFVPAGSSRIRRQAAEERKSYDIQQGR